MVTTLKAQVLMFTLAIGVIAPVTAMDSHQETSSWFGWRSVAGITILVGAGALWAYHAWTKPVSKRPVTKKAAIKKVKDAKTDQEEQSTSGPLLVNSSTRIKSIEELEYENNLAEFKPEFVASEMKRLDTLIAQIEHEIVQEQGKK